VFHSYRTKHAARAHSHIIQMVSGAAAAHAGEVDVMVNVFTLLPFDSQTLVRLTCHAWSRCLLGSRLSTRPWTLRVSSATPLGVIRGLCHGLLPQQLVTDSPSILWAAVSPASGLYRLQGLHIVNARWAERNVTAALRIPRTARSPAPYDSDGDYVARASMFSFDSVEASLIAAHTLWPQVGSPPGVANSAVLVELHLADIEVTAYAGRALGGSLRRNQTLTSLDLSMGEAARMCQQLENERLDESNAGLPSVLDAISGNQTLRILRLAGRKGAHFWFSRLLALVTRPQRLEELDLENNELVPPSAAARLLCNPGEGTEIEAFLRTVATSDTLTELNVSMNNLGMEDETAEALAFLIERNQGLRVLRVQNNGLFQQDVSRVRFGRMAQALSGHKSLRHLNVSMNQVTLAMGARLGGIVRDLPQLTTLELGGGWGCWWGLDDDEFGATYLVEFGACVGAGSCLRSLSIHTNGITSDQLVSISAALKAAVSLEDLNLGGNIFGHGGVHGMAALAEMVTEVSWFSVHLPTAPLPLRTFTPCTCGNTTPEQADGSQPELQLLAHAARPGLRAGSRTRRAVPPSRPRPLKQLRGPGIDQPR